MLWLDRPPYLRWLAASTLVVLALGLEVSGPDLEPYPFVQRSIAAGEAVAVDDLEWRDVPVGILPEPSAVIGPAARKLEVGEPLIAGAVRAGSMIPDGWWVVPAPIPAAASPGVTVRLISVDDGFAVDGIVAASGVDTGFGDEAIGAVAVPEEAAVRVSLAASSNRLVVLVAP
ncbi:MAG TPA: hypothetical protein ENG98_01945 [Actinobacteria bacterium]|nr:SAF domain protein [bacterium BMS3Bbin02]HDL41762.1 hypothetical protein [Actinomycetota bacterium]